MDIISKFKWILLEIFVYSRGFALNVMFAISDQNVSYILYEIVSSDLLKI
jgi:hypothetical protein